MQIEIRRADGATRFVLPGENFDSDWEPTGKIVNGGGVTLLQEDQEAHAMLVEIERELATEGKGLGDWVAFFAKPVALLLGKDNCLSCEFRKVCLNAVKKLRAKYGDAEGKRRAKELIKRSFTEDAGALALELKRLLEE